MSLVLRDEPVPWRAWLADLRAHRGVLLVLARKDFQARYKRASLGIAWAVAVPLVQGAVLAVVFSQVLDTDTGDGFGAYVLAGVIAWAYFSSSFGTASTAIVDGAGMAEKVWFPRVVLVVVPLLANLVALGASLVFLVVVAPLLGGVVGTQTLWLVPAVALLGALCLGLATVTAALHVYFRDVRFLVQAALLVWFYVTPIVYTRDLLGDLEDLIDLNPMTGVVELFHAAVTPGAGIHGSAVVVSIAATVVLIGIGAVAQHRHDRVFVDLL